MQLGAGLMRADETAPKGPIRRAVDEVVGTGLIVLTISFFAAFPMYWIFGHWTLWTFAVGGAVTAAFWAQSANTRRRQRNIAQGWMDAGWVDVAPRPWPWTGQNPGVVEVRFAKSRMIRDFPVTVIEAFWVGGGMGNAATSFAGLGTIIVVRLPHSYPPAGVRDRMPTWTILGTELYSVVADRPFTAVSGNRTKQPPPSRPLPLALVPAAVDRVIAVVDALGIRAEAAPEVS
jgi:hypothetical protein